MNKLSMLLLSSSTVISSMLLMVLTDKPARATELDQLTNHQSDQKVPSANLPCDRQSCTGNAHLAKFVNTFLKKTDKDLPPLAEDFNVERTEEGHLILEISEEESDAAIQLFGCDCITSINALRQMRGITTGVEGDKILPGPKIKPCSQQSPKIGN